MLRPEEIGPLPQLHSYLRLGVKGKIVLFALKVVSGSVGLDLHPYHTVRGEVA
jgi:hypothetical protein